MDKHYDPGRLEISLVQRADQKRETLDKMRRKLGVPPAAGAKIAVHREAAGRKTYFRWGSALLLAAALLAGSFGLRAPREEAAAPVRQKRAPTLNTAPPSLTVDQQALYWTYALFDFEKLRGTFGAPRGAAVNTAQARENLRALLPKVDARTRLTVEGYLPKNWGKP